MSLAGVIDAPAAAVLIAAMVLATISAGVVFWRNPLGAAAKLAELDREVRRTDMAAWQRTTATDAALRALGDRLDADLAQRGQVLAQFSNLIQSEQAVRIDERLQAERLHARTAVQEAINGLADLWGRALQTERSDRGAEIAAARDLATRDIQAIGNELQGLRGELAKLTERVDFNIAESVEDDD